MRFAISTTVGGLLLAGVCSCTTHRGPSGPPALAPAKDLWPKPFKHVVILGESTVQGGGWLESSRDRYADVLIRLINEVQAEPVEYVNKGIGANSISPKSPGYAASIKPSAMERYKADVIDNKPDLFILAYGLNDMRAGMDVNGFIQEMEVIVRDVQATCHPLIVLVNVYHMSRYDWFGPFNRGGVEATIRYNRAIRDLARRTGCLYADAYAAEGRADWLVHQDSVHANKVGSLLIAHEIFEVLATHCSGLSQETNKRNEDTLWTRSVRVMQHATTRPVNR